MFDPESSKLLQSAPSLPGITASDLPRLLTEIYTELVTERVRGIEEQVNEQSIIRLTEIANSYEILAASGNDSDSTRASAFVAGSAYQILAKNASSDPEFSDNYLSRDHISGDLAAALLFLIAQQLPDAKEAIRRFTGTNQDAPETIKNLGLSLIDLVNENFESIINRNVNRKRVISDQLEPQVQATVYLYDLILQGIELLAANILEKESSENKAKTNHPNYFFQRVVDSATKVYQIEGIIGNFLSTYPGPSHLATLLLHLGPTLQSASVLLLPPPDRSDKDRWKAWLNYRAKQKALLWPNHRKAIDLGFHLPGNSAILVLPTGAGKTTISEFKIAATLAAGKQVLFLAPTNALVEQLKNDLNTSIPAEIFGIDENYDADLYTSIASEISDLSVMTPEKCLAVLNFNPDAFMNVGLVVFDECHSLSSTSGSLRRALDGMLVILRLSSQLPEVDFLFLSAMIKEPQEFAEWIGHLTKKPCIHIDLLWKPSRQARGVIIYEKEEIIAAEKLATDMQRELDQKKNKRAAKVRTGPKALIKVVPHALFGMVNNWLPNRSEDICIRQLANESYFLNAEMNNSRIVFAKQNGNEVSRQLAIASAKAGLKTIVFINNTLWANSSARRIASLLDENITYTAHEKQLLLAIETEFGQPECSMLYGLKGCVQHHADLISHERQLAESLFKRENGAKVIFATTTLSQGMNLPAQVAILSANERASLDGEFITQEPMKPHELLNAAGRAGRAGYLANGLVILVSRELLTFEGNTPESAAHTVLQSIIPEDERCVQMIDPLMDVLDKIQTGEPLNADIEYFIYRLGMRNEEDSAVKMFKRSLGYFIAEKVNKKKEYEAAITSFVQIIDKQKKDLEIPNWIVQISIQSGISPNILNTLHSTITEQFEDLPKTVIEWTNWMLEWLEKHIDASQFCFGIELLPLQTIGSVSKVLSVNFSSVMKTLKKGMQGWLAGDTLSTLEISMGGTLSGIKIYCPKAREIATNLAPRNLSYFSTFIVQITKKIAEQNNVPIISLAVLECLPSAIAKGADSPLKLAYMRLQKNRYRSRVDYHEEFNKRFSDLELTENSDYSTVLQFMASLLSN